MDASFKRFWFDVVLGVISFHLPFRHFFVEIGRPKIDIQRDRVKSNMRARRSCIQVSNVI